MKRSLKGIAWAVALTAVALGGGVMDSVRASAGSSQVYIASQVSLGEQGINTGDFIVEGGVFGQSKKAFFNQEKCVDGAKLIAKGKVNNMMQYGIKMLFDSKTNVCINDLPVGAKISFVYGMNSLSHGSGSKDSFEVALSKDEATGRIWLELNQYITEGQVTQISRMLLTEDSVRAGKDFTVSAYTNTDNCLTLTVGKTSVVERYPLSVDATGYIGVIAYANESDVCADFTLSDVNITAYKYELAETIDCSENFNNGEYNTNYFYSKSTAGAMSPSALFVKDGALCFQNTADAFISTQYTYSNFELSFDLLDLSRTAEYDENGNLVRVISNWFGIAFGVDTINKTAGETVQTESWLHFDGIPMDVGGVPVDHTEYWLSPRYVLYSNWTPLDVTSMEDFNVWNPQFDNQVINVKFSVTDGVVELWMKTSAEKEYKACYSYDIGYSKTGYVRLFTYGEANVPEQGMSHATIGNFTIDNLAIKNTDFEAERKTLEDPGYKSNVQDRTEDFDYTTTVDDNDLLGNKISAQEAESGCSGSLVATSGAVGIVGALAIALKRRKK